MCSDWWVSRHGPFFNFCILVVPINELTSVVSLVISSPPARRQQSFPAFSLHARSLQLRGRLNRAWRISRSTLGGSNASGASPILHRRCVSYCREPEVLLPADACGLFVIALRIQLGSWLLFVYVTNVAANKMRHFVRCHMFVRYHF